MNGKYTNALPLYRISQEFEREGLNRSVPTMDNWVIRCAERYLYPLWDRLRAAQADETPCHVQKDGRAANAKSFMFVYRDGEFLSNKPVVLYDYQKMRNSEHLENFLEGFSGVLVSDAFSGYHALENRRPKIRVAHCWAHARRDFTDALKAFKRTEAGGRRKQRIRPNW